jgi:peptidylprolyl isomerase
MRAVGRGQIPIAAVCAALALAIAGCGSSSNSSSSSSTSSGETSAAKSTGSTASQTNTKVRPKITVPSEPAPKKLTEKEIVKGTGAEAKSGKEVTVQYAGVGYESGEEFDASWNRGEPFSFKLGAGEVIPGWDQGVAGMKVGGRRELIIPPELAYGPSGSPPAIGPNETLIFVIDLLAVK